MSHTFHELKLKTVAELREIAKGLEHDAVRGYSSMHKDKLLLALCSVLGVDAHEHHEVVGIDKAALKKQIQELKVQRDVALEAHDRDRLRKVRREIHRRKRQIREATV